MNLPPLPLKNGVLEIDNSFIEKLTTCPRALQYAYLQKRIPSGDRPPLNFGSAIHAALEYRYKTLKNEPPTFLDNQDIFDKVLQPYFANNPQPEEDHRTLQFAYEIVEQYNSRYAHEPFSLMVKDDGSVMAEMSFAVPLFEFTPKSTQWSYENNEYYTLEQEPIKVIYTGRIDLPVLWDNQIVIGDHKTTGMLGSFYMDGLKVSPQFEGYCWAFEQLTGKKVSGFFINAIRTKSKPGKPTKGWDSWWDESFSRHKEYLRPGQLDEWKNNTIQLIKEFFYHYSNDFMPQKKKACTMYGKCPYYDICYLPEESRQQMLKSDQFTNNEWSPLK